MFKKRIFTNLYLGLIAVICILIFFLFIKGNKGNPIAFQNTNDSRVEGPFELTNSNSRYALTESIVNQGTFFFNDAQARFSAPDLVAYNNKFFSIFTPGISFLGIPFYLVGKYIGYPQLFTYFSTHLFAFLNVLLIALLTIKLGGKIYHGIMGGLVFLFGTNALGYSLTFTQHHASTLLLLLGILNALGERTLIKNVLFGMIFGAGMLVDIPNAFLLFPVAIYILYKNFAVKKIRQKSKLILKIGVTGLFIGLVPFIALYSWYNYQTTGSYTKIAQFIGRSDYPKPIQTAEAKEIKIEEKDTKPRLFKVPFDTRLQFNGLYILLASEERGIFYYSPILLIGLLGLFIAYKNKKFREAGILTFSVICTNVILYSMFGDPWGGWAFGPRYLIPAEALLSAGIGIAVWRFIRNPIFISAFFILLFYSVIVTFSGALTTNGVPPKGEALNLITPIPYTYEYNFQFIDENLSSSLIYNIFLQSFISLRSFLYAVVVVFVLLIVSLYLVIYFKKNDG